MMIYVKNRRLRRGHDLVWFARRLLRLRKNSSNPFADGEAGRKAGRFDPEEIDEPPHAVTLGAVDAEIAFIAGSGDFRTEPRIARLQTVFGEIRPEAPSALPERRRLLSLMA